MSTTNDLISSLSTDMTEVTNRVSHVNYTSKETVTVTDSTVARFITDVTKNKTASEIATDVTIKGTTTSDLITGVSPSNTSNDFVTDVTFYETSQPVTEKMSTVLRSTTLKMEDTKSGFLNSSQILFTNASSSPSFTSTATTVRVDSDVEVQTLCDECTTTVAIVSAVSAGAVLLVLLMSVLCFFRLRHKWRSKIQLERRKTDIWSMATYNNTIINENFNDYQLASPKDREFRKSSGFSQNSINLFDPFSGATPQTQFSPNLDAIVLRSDTLPEELDSANSTLRRNTFSAPDELDSSPRVFRGQDSLGFNDDRYTSRGRSSTFNLGRKQNVDRHILLSHEELVEDRSTSEHVDAVYKTPTNSYYVTELRSKIQLERRKTDIWSMATYNNTIINENFNDYQLASPKDREFRKSSGFSQNSINLFDPFSGATPQTQFSPNLDAIVLRSDTLPEELDSANSTLRRNTFSAPDELDSSPRVFRGQDSLGFNDDRYTSRGRSSTFNLGRKQNVDRHILLSHEELVEDRSTSEHVDAVYKTPTNSYYVTEL